MRLSLVINIDYNIKPDLIISSIKIPVQGGLDPKYLLSDKETLKKESLKILDIFKDHPYIFNLEATASYHKQIQIWLII